MIKKGFATLTVTLVLSAVALIAVFYLSKGMLFNAKKANDEAVYYEAYNAAHSGMTQALKTVTKNNKRLPCLFESKETKNKGTVNNNCYCRPDDNAVNENSEVVCEGQFSFNGEQKENSKLISTYITTIRHDKSGLFEIVSAGQANGFEAILRTVYQSIGGMKTIPKSAIVATGSVYIVGNSEFRVKDGSVQGGSIETGVSLPGGAPINVFYDKFLGVQAPTYAFTQIKAGEHINGISVSPPAIDTTDGVSVNNKITGNSKASEVYLGDEFMQSKPKFLSVNNCNAVVGSLSKAKAQGKLDNHVWIDLDAKSIHKFTPHDVLPNSGNDVWGCDLSGALPNTMGPNSEPLNIVINLVGFPDKNKLEEKEVYDYITDINKGLIIYLRDGGQFRGMISFIDSVKDNKFTLKFKAGSSVTMEGTILLDSNGKAWFESSFNMAYDSKLLDYMSEKLKSQGIMAGSWSDY